MTRTKPTEAQPKFRLLVRYTFHANSTKVAPRNVSYIEHLLRKGVRQLESYENPAVKDCWVSEEMVAWHNARSTNRERIDLYCSDRHIHN